MNRKINSALALAIVALFSFFVGVFLVVNMQSMSQVSFFNFSKTARGIDADNPIVKCAASNETPWPGEPNLYYNGNGSSWKTTNRIYSWTGDVACNMPPIDPKTNKPAIDPQTGMPVQPNPPAAGSPGDGLTVPPCGPFTAPRAHLPDGPGSKPYIKLLALGNDSICYPNNPRQQPYKCMASAVASCTLNPKQIEISCDGDVTVEAGQTATVTWTITDPHAPDTTRYKIWVRKDPLGDKTWDVDKGQFCKTSVAFYPNGNAHVADSQGVKTVSCKFTPTKAREGGYTLTAKAFASDGYNLITNTDSCTINVGKATPTPLPPVKR